jgi:hypothetical protein
MDRRYRPAQQRRKPFPWGDKDCDLMDVKCHRKAREARA